MKNKFNKFVFNILNFASKIKTGNKIKTSAASVLAGIIISLIVLLVFAPAPLSACIDFITGTFTSAFYFGTFLNTAVLLALAALGNSISIKSGNLNLGGEGQIYTGGFIASIIFASELPLPIAAVAGIVCAAASGIIQVLISALLRQFKKANVLLTSFLISAAIIPIIDSLISGKFRGQTGNLLATQFIPEKLRLLQILPPSPLNVSVFALPILCILFSYFLNHSKTGMRLKIWGTAPEFARYCGYSENKALYLSLIISGGMHGLTGAVAVLGTYYTCHSGFYAGMGWNALSCALIAQSEPALIIPASLVLSWLYTSAGRVSLMQGLQFDISSLIQGIILFCISINYIARKRRT